MLKIPEKAAETEARCAAADSAKRGCARRESKAGSHKMLFNRVRFRLEITNNMLSMLIVRSENNL